MFPTRSVIVVLVICVHLAHFTASKGGKKRGFEAVLENVQECKHPSPHYAKKSTIIPKYKIVIINGTRYLSGNTTVTAPTRFLNFSGRSFAVDSVGKRDVKFQISQVSCRNILARALIKFSKVSLSTNNCILQKVYPVLAYDGHLQGFYRYDNIDINKVTHALPGWHTAGDVVHELQLVSDGDTEFCTEIKVKITG